MSVALAQSLNHNTDVTITGEHLKCVTVNNRPSQSDLYTAEDRRFKSCHYQQQPHTLKRIPKSPSSESTSANWIEFWLTEYFKCVLVC